GCPTPTQANSRIRYVAYIVMRNVHTLYKARSDSHRSPIFIRCMMNEVVSNNNFSGQLPFILRMKRQMRLHLVLGKSTDQHGITADIIKDIAFEAILEIPTIKIESS